MTSAIKEKRVNKNKVIFGAGLLVLVCFLLYGAKPNFSGKWILDKDKSKVKEKKVSELMLSIKHKKNNLNVTEIKKKGKKEAKHTYKYTLDGKENTHTTKKGVKIISKATLSSDGKIVILDRTEVSRMEGKEKKEIVNIKMSISEDGKVLTVETAQLAPKKKKPVQQIFNKSKETETPVKKK
jgi:hypothetical protein